MGVLEQSVNGHRSALAERLHNFSTKGKRLALRDRRPDSGGMVRPKPRKLTIAERCEQKRARGCRLLFRDLVCNHSEDLNTVTLPGNISLSDIEPRMRCTRCGKSPARTFAEYMGRRIGKQAGCQAVAAEASLTQ